MVRQKRKQQGRFFLRRRSRVYGIEYYHESGTQNVGTPDEQDYINWTRYLDEARGFQKMKEARAMANLLWSKYGWRVSIVDHYGAEVY